MGRIVKGGVQRESRPGLPVPLDEARAQAEAIVAAGRAEAERIEGAARNDAAAAREVREAQRQGDRAQLRAEMEEEVVGLALAVAAKVLELAVEDPRAARESARRALRQAQGHEPRTLRCHPADEAGLRAAVGELRVPEGSAAAPLAILPDPAVGRGGVLLETGAGVVDARVEQQLRALARGLGEAR